MSEISRFRGGQAAANNKHGGEAGSRAKTAKARDTVNGALISLAKAARDTGREEEAYPLILEALSAPADNEDELNKLVLTIHSEKIALTAGKCCVSGNPYADYDFALIRGGDDDPSALKSLLFFGLRGMAAFVRFNRRPDQSRKDAAVFFCEVLTSLSEEHTAEERIAAVMKLGKYNLDLMRLPDKTEEADPRAGDIVSAVKSGALKRVFLIADCDGGRESRGYFTDLVKALPSDSFVLTPSRGENRFDDPDPGTAADRPRLTDEDHLHHARDAVAAAAALVKSFDRDGIDPPLDFLLSMDGYPAVAVLLTLIDLGIKKIRLGPALPACLSENDLRFLAKTFAIRPVSTAKEDLKIISEP